MPRTAEAYCPHCGYRTDAATAVDGSSSVPKEKEGDFSVCICCRSVSVFRADQTLRCPTMKETAEAQRALAALRS